MMTQCPQCGSKDIIPDLIVLARVAGDAGQIGVTMEHPKGKDEPASVGVRVAVCGACGHAELYTRFPKDLLDAYKKGYVTHKL